MLNYSTMIVHEPESLEYMKMPFFMESAEPLDPEEYGPNAFRVDRDWFLETFVKSLCLD